MFKTSYSRYNKIWGPYKKIFRKHCHRMPLVATGLVEPLTFAFDIDCSSKVVKTYNLCFFAN